MTDSAVGAPTHDAPGNGSVDSSLPGPPGELALAAVSAVLMFAVVPIVLGVFALAAPKPPPTAVVLAVGGASLLTALALLAMARQRRLDLDGLFAGDLWATVLIGVVVAFSGRYRSPYVELFLLAVVHAGAFQPRARVLTVVLATLLAYLVPAVAIAGLTSSDAADAVIPALTIVLAGGLTHAAAERLRRQRDVWANREAAARQLADEDPLTGLGNYRLFWRSVEGEMARVQRYGGVFSLVLLDLDRFKAVNDDLGHRAGDAVLQRVARALAGELRREDVICRHGGDEFAVVAVQAGPEEAAHLADRLAVAVAGAGTVDRHRVTATAGWATFGIHADSIEELVLHADDAMRGAKRESDQRSTLARAVGGRAPAPTTRDARPPSPSPSPLPVAMPDGAPAGDGARATGRLALLGSLARALAAARDERTAIEVALTHLLGAVDAEIVAAARLHREAARLELVSLAGARVLAPPPTQAADAGILGAAVLGEAPVVVPDVRRDPRYIGLPDLPQVRSELAVPVFERGRLWGVLNLEADRVDAYTADDARLVQAVAVQLGRALAFTWAFARLGGDGPILRAYELAAAVQEPGDECWRVADLAWRLGRELGLAGEELESLYLGALFHDVGTVGVPAELMTKPGRLTDQELALVREHPVIGERMLRPLPRLRGAAAVVRHEHERFDGDGYPDGLAGTEIPLASRILQACDAYVAMTSERAFREALGYTDAVAELRRGAGSQLDPDVVAELLRLLGSGEPRPVEVDEVRWR